MKTKKWVVLIVSILFIVGLAAVTTVKAQEADPPAPSDDEVNEIAKSLYCPVCPNTPLDVCETKACKDWREQIRSQLADGWAEGEIMAYFVEQYGERVLAEPQRQGFTSLVWVLPLTMSILGLVLVWSILTRWKRSSPPAAAPDLDEIDPAMRARIEEELKALD